MKFFFGLFIYSGIAFSQTWMQIPSFPGTERDDGVAVVIGTKAYVGSGLTAGWTFGADFYCYDVLSQSWSPIVSMPAGSERQYACAFKGGQGFYVFGGDGSGGVLNTLFEYNIANSNWTQKTPKPGAGIYGASCFEFGDTVIIAGGRYQGNAINNEAWMYRISTDSWQQLNSLPAGLGGRWRAAYAVLKGKGYLLFGLDGNNAWRKELMEYDPRFDSWTKIMEVQTFPSLAYASLQGMEGKLLLFAGMDSLNNYSPACRYFELSTYTWSQGPSLNAIPRRGGMSWTYNNSFFYSCGLDENEQRLKETWKLDLVIGLKEESPDSVCQIGPNPFAEAINIETGAEGANKLELWNASGILIISETLVSKTRSILNTSQAPSGFYILKLYKGEKLVATKKLIKH